MIALNNTLHNPLPEKEVVQATKSAEKYYAAGKIFRCSNSYVIQTLNITPAEMQYLQVFISPEERKNRKKVRNQRAYLAYLKNTGKKTKKDQIRDRRIAIEKMIRKGYSVVKICETLHISRATLYSDLKIIQAIAGEKEEKKETVESEMNAEVKKTAQTFRSVYMKEKSELNTLKAKRKIINCLEEKGYAAVDCDNQIDMVNREKVEEFCKAAEKEEQAAVDIVVVFDEGEIIQYHLESMNGKINVRLCQVKWKDNSPQANYYDEYEAYEWKYTEKGYLFLEEYHPPGFDGAPGETGFRVQPLDKTCRELNRKYVMPLGYALNNLLITNWDNQNYTELDFYDLYEKMYYMKYGKQVPYEANYGGVEYEVPEDEFEEVIKTYLPFSNSEIEKGTFYNSDNRTFRYRPRGLYDCEFPYEPYPEVISYEKLQDGTLKLTIEAVWEIRMLDQAITSELMIKPMEDGSFQYLSNKVIKSDQNANAGWYMPRLTEEEWEENYSNN